MTPTETTVQVPVTVSLDSASYEKLQTLVPGDIPPAQKIEAVVDGLLGDLSEGGLMLTGDEVKRIHEVSPGAGPEEIIAAVEDGGGMEDGQIKVPFYLDPTLLEPLKNIADMQGFSVQEVVQNMMDHAIEQGWFYALEPQPKVMFFGQDEYHLLAKAMGKEDPTGIDLISWLKQNGLTEETAEDITELFKEPEEDDGDQKALNPGDSPADSV